MGRETRSTARSAGLVLGPGRGRSSRAWPMSPYTVAVSTWETGFQDTPMLSRATMGQGTATSQSLSARSAP